MGWTCQHDHDGYCKLVQKACIPGMKGCILKRNDEGIIFSGDLHDTTETQRHEDETVDFAALARSH